MKKILLLIFSFFTVTITFSQNRYWVFFTDKNNCTFDPYSYFDKKAIDRRIKQGLSLNDISDYPVNETYLSEVKYLVDSINIITRWFNGVSVYASENQISKVEQLYCVKKIQPIKTYAVITNYKTDSLLTPLESRLLEAEMNGFQADYFTKNNIDGKGVRIAVFDVGFIGTDTLKAFEHLRKNNKILKTYDFHKKKKNVYFGDSHGTNVLSCITGIINGEKLGMATGAEFLLAKTEILREMFAEEEYWLAAAEWADQNGADIINSSLGYTIPRYSQKDMDGEITLVSKAAKMASDKGILVINAMGNDGDTKWKLLGAPADVKEVLSVGGVDPCSNIWIDFSSLGPNANKQMKPNVCAAGKALVAGDAEDLEIAYGTSFATPLVTGFAACVLQTDSSLTNTELKTKIEKSGHLYPYFDYAHGYGIPQASYFFDVKKSIIDTNFTVEYLDREINVKFKDINEYKENYFFYKIEHANGTIALYSVVKMTKNKLTIKLKKIEEGDTFIAFFNGYILKKKLNLTPNQ